MHLGEILDLHSLAVIKILSQFTHFFCQILFPKFLEFTKKSFILSLHCTELHSIALHCTAHSVCDQTRRHLQVSLTPD